MESAVPEYETARLLRRYAGQESGLATMPRIGGYMRLMMFTVSLAAVSAYSEMSKALNSS